MKTITRIVRKLRNNMTEAENHLWYTLKRRNLGVKFRRQVLIGRYIVDFVCYEKNLILEVDGGQHAESKTDLERDKWLQSQGFKVLRFWNNEVFENREGVCEKILNYINPLPNPPHKGEGIDRNQV